MFVLSICVVAVEDDLDSLACRGGSAWSTRTSAGGTLAAWSTGATLSTGGAGVGGDPFGDGGFLHWRQDGFDLGLEFRTQFLHLPEALPALKPFELGEGGGHDPLDLGELRFGQFDVVQCAHGNRLGSRDDHQCRKLLIDGGGLRGGQNRFHIIACLGADIPHGFACGCLHIGGEFVLNLGDFGLLIRFERGDQFDHRDRQRGEGETAASATAAPTALSATRGARTAGGNGARGALCTGSGGTFRRLCKECDR